MAKRPIMASRLVTGMHKRPGSDKWWLRIMVPVTLRKAFYEGRSKVRFSLGTDDRELARTLALAEHAKWSERFRREAAQLSPKPLDFISPDLVEVIANRAAARVLALDDEVRLDPEMRRAFLAVWAPLPAPRFFTVGMAEPEPEPVTEPEAQSFGMKPAQLEALKHSHSLLVSGLSRGLAMGQLKDAEIWASAEAAKLGIVVDWSKNTPALLKIARAVVEAWMQVSARDHGATLSTPAMPEVPAALAESLRTETATTIPKGRKDKALTLWDVRDEWAKGQSRDAQGKMDRALNKLDASGCTMVLADLTRQDALNFREHIRETMADRTPKTQSDVLANVQTLLNFAVSERGYLEVNPWAGTAIAKGKPTHRREPWTTERLSGLFALPLFKSYQLLDDPRAGGPAAYWAPLIIAYSGMRASEVAQLRVRDVVTKDGVLLFDVNDEEDKRVKTDAGRRRVPVHSRLLALGFRDYLEDKRDAGGPDGPLFPLLPTTASRGPGEYLSDSFRRIARDAGVYQRWSDLHAMRTTVNSQLRAVSPALDSATILDLMGHEGHTVNEQHYTVLPPKTLQKALENVHHEADKLVRTYPSRKA